MSGQVMNFPTPTKGEPGGLAHEKRSKDGVVFQYRDCNNRMLAETLDKLDNHTGWDAKTIYAFSRIKDRYDEEQKKFRQNFTKLVRKYAVMEPVTKASDTDKNVQVPVLDEKTGKPKMKPKTVELGRGMQDFVFRDKKGFDQAFKDLGLIEFSVKAYKLTAQELLEAGLNPRELRACIMLTEDADPEILASYRRHAEEDVEDDDEDAEEEEAESTAVPAEATDGPQPASEPTAP